MMTQSTRSTHARMCTNDRWWVRCQCSYRQASKEILDSSFANIHHFYSIGNTNGTPGTDCLVNIGVDDFLQGHTPPPKNRRAANGSSNNSFPQCTSLEVA